MNTFPSVHLPENEAVLQYAPGSIERELLSKSLKEQLNTKIGIPLVIGGEDIFTPSKGNIVCPHDHQQILAEYSKADEDTVGKAIQAAMKAKKEWSRTSWSERAAVMLKAAELIADKYRYEINASTMLGQSKNPYQAEIDSACETIDFLRYNVAFAAQIYQMQPKSTNNQTNQLDYRPLEGFVFAVSPFNFTSIASNLNMAAIMMGNTTVWKPASTALYSNYLLMKIFAEAGLPEGVINFVPGNGAEIGEIVLKHPELAGVHFTGSNSTFNFIWKEMAKNLEIYRSYPKRVGETGGKNFIFVHESAGIKEVSTAIVRGAFEYQGQKCSAVSRAYVPKNLWSELKDELLQMTSQIKMGDVMDFSNFMNAVINEAAFDKIMEYIQLANDSMDCTIIAGGKGDKSKGYFIEPTIIVTVDPHFITMEEEIFGPVVTLFLYDPNSFEETLRLCNTTSPYGLTGAIFSSDKYAVRKASEILRFAAGNFYINDKPTGAVVGMQPFGGSRASGTNDKAGGLTNLLRWTNPRNIKENLVPPTDFKYPFMND